MNTHAVLAYNLERWWAVAVSSVSQCKQKLIYKGYNSTVLMNENENNYYPNGYFFLRRISPILSIDQVSLLWDFAWWPFQGQMAKIEGSL